MHFREAFHSNYALGLTGIFAAFGFPLVANHHFVAGSILVAVAAIMLGGWVATLPNRSMLTRFWILFVLGVGTTAFLAQMAQDEDEYQMSLPSGDLVAANAVDSAINCGHYSVSQSNWVGVLVGSNTFLNSTFPYNVIVMNGRPILTISKSDQGINASIFIYDTVGNIVARLLNNHFEVNTNSVMNFSRNDKSSIEIKDRLGNLIFSIHMDSKNKLTVSGLILYSNDPVVINKLGIYMKEFSSSGNCVIGYPFNVAPEGIGFFTSPPAAPPASPRPPK